MAGKGLREAVPGNGAGEDCEEAGGEAALAGEEEHQEEAPAVQDGMFQIVIWVLIVLAYKNWKQFVLTQVNPCGFFPLHKKGG